MNDVSLTSIMVFHFDSAIQIMEEILTHELVNPEELYEILEYMEKDSESIQEERIWKMFSEFIPTLIFLKTH